MTTGINLSGVQIGYARVSSKSQSLDVQVAALTAAGCNPIRTEKVSGRSMTARAELRAILDFIRAGDVLVVTRIDRLARSVLDLQTIVKELKSKGAYLKATEQAVDMTTPSGKAFLDMLGVFGEFETSLRAERQAEGIAKAKEEGRKLGRRITVDAARVAELAEKGMKPAHIARELGIGRASVYRALEAVKS